MRMKKLIFMFLAILLCGIVQAQTSEIILNNGKVVKGKIQSLSFNVDNTHEVRIKNEVSGEKFDYTSADVKEIKFYDKKAKEVTNWIPLYAQMGLGMSYKKAPKLYKNPVFLHPVYKGEKHFSVCSLHKYKYSCEIGQYLRIWHYVLLQIQGRGLCEKLLFDG